MKRLFPILSLFLCLVLVPSVKAQFTTVSATVVDPNSVPYANCHVSASYVPSPTATTQALIAGSTFQTVVPAFQCDSFGHFSVTLVDNTQVSDGHSGGQTSKWSFSITSGPGYVAGPYSFTYTAVISGATMDISAALKAAAAPFPALSSSFSGITSGTNTIASMLVGTGASLGATGSGTISATTMPWSGLTSYPTGCTNQVVTAILLAPTCTTITSSYTSGTFPATFSGITGSTNTTAAMLVGTGSSLATTGSGSITATGVTNGGTLNPASSNNFFFVDGVTNTTIAQAAAAADVGLANCSFTTSCGTVVIPPKYAGTDTFNNAGINLLILDYRSKLFNAPSINVPTFVTSIDSDATYPAGRDMNFFPGGPAGLYFRRSTVDTTTTASLSVGANTSVLVGTVNNHNVDLGNVQTGTLLTLFSIGTATAPQKIYVGRETTNNEQLTYNATANCPTSGTWNIVDGTHLCLNTTKTHAGTTDIEEPPDPVRYDFTDLQIRSYQARPSQDATTCLPMFVNDFNGVNLMTLPSDSTCAAPRNQPAFNSGFNIYVGGGVLSGSPVSTSWESFTLGGPNFSMSNIDQGGTIRGFVGPFYGGTTNNGSFGAIRMQNQTYVTQRNAALNDESCFTLNATDQWIFSRNCSGGGGALTSATIPIATGTFALTSNTTTTTTQVLHASATAGLGTYSAIATGDLPTAIPIANIGTSGLSGTAPVTINAAGAIGCATCVVNNSTNAGTAAMTLNMAASTTANSFVAPAQAGLTSGTNGAIAYDTTNNNTHIRTNAADSIAVAEAAALAANVIPKQTDATHGLVAASLASDNGTALTYTGTGGVLSSGNNAILTTDFTDTSSASLQNVTGLNFTLPANTARNYEIDCNLMWSQATFSGITDQFGLQDVTVAPTRIDGYGLMSVAGPGAVITNAIYGVLTNLTTTTATAIVSAIPTVATINFAQLHFTVQQPSNASTSVLQIMVSQSTAADVIVVRAGSSCRLN
jgi:hypothetical protein